MSKLSSATIWLAGIQWLFFIFANTVVVPLSVGAAFDLQPEEIAASLQRSFIFTGAASILQAVAGHRYALMEGPAGLWWGLILSLCASAQSVGMSLTTIGGGLATGILLAGLTTVLLGAMGFANILKKVFTPIVMSVYLFLLSSQLMMIFLKGMLGLSNDNELDLPVAALSIVIAILVGLLSIKGRGLIGDFSILIGMVIGWIAYNFLFPVEKAVTISTESPISWFPWGTPNLELGIIITAFLAGLINMTNTIAAVSATEKLYQTTTTDQQYKRTFLLTGVYTIVAAVLGLVPYGPYTSSIGLLESTRILERLALVVGGALFVILGLVPALGALFTTIPISIGSAVLFVAYLQLFGTALRTIEGIHFNSKTIYRIAAPTLLGLCIMNISPEVFETIPMYIRPLVSNGLLMGVLLALVLESFVNWSKYELLDSRKNKQSIYKV